MNKRLKLFNIRTAAKNLTSISLKRKGVNTIRTSKARRILTVDEVVNIYFMWKKQGLGNSQIANKLGLDPGSVHSARKYIGVYWQPKMAHARFGRYTYKEAVKQIKLKLMADARAEKSKILEHSQEHNQNAERSTTHTNSQPVEPSQERAQGDHFEDFKNSFDAFQKSIQVFVEAEVSRRSESVIKELKEVKAQLKQKTEDFEKAEEAFGIARNSNWVDNLKKEWGIAKNQ